MVEVDATISTDLVPFMTAANMIVTKACTSSGYTAEELEMIERWLAAHFYTIRDNRVASEGVKGINASYQHAVGLMLKSSMQGQTAMVLDTHGNLAALSARMERGQGGKIRVVALGEDCPAGGDIA